MTTLRALAAERSRIASELHDVVVSDDCEWDVTWLATGMTAAQAKERLDRTEFDEPVRLME